MEGPVLPVRLGPHHARLLECRLHHGGGPALGAGGPIPVAYTYTYSYSLYLYLYTIPIPAPIHVPIPIPIPMPMPMPTPRGLGSRQAHGGAAAGCRGCPARPSEEYKWGRHEWGHYTDVGSARSGPWTRTPNARMKSAIRRGTTGVSTSGVTANLYGF